jgi:hypothetical protein
VANARERRGERRLIQRIKKELESSVFGSGPPAPVPFYEQNLFVGSLSIFLSIVGVAVATVYGLKWMLWVALPFGVIAMWITATAIGLRKAWRVLFLAGPIVLVVVLFVKMSHRPTTATVLYILPISRIPISSNVTGTRWMLRVRHRGTEDSFNVRISLTDGGCINNATPRQGPPRNMRDCFASIGPIREVEANEFNLAGPPSFYWITPGSQRANLLFQISDEKENFVDILAMKNTGNSWALYMRLQDGITGRKIFSCRDENFKPDTPLTESVSISCSSYFRFSRN